MLQGSGEGALFSLQASFHPVLQRGAPCNCLNRLLQELGPSEAVVLNVGCNHSDFNPEVALVSWLGLASNCFSALDL